MEITLLNEKPTNFHVTCSRKKIQEYFFPLTGSQFFDYRRIPPQIFANSKQHKNKTKKTKVKK